MFRFTSSHCVPHNDPQLAFYSSSICSGHQLQLPAEVDPLKALKNWQRSRIILRVCLATLLDTKNVFVASKIQSQKIVRLLLTSSWELSSSLVIERSTVLIL